MSSDELDRRSRRFKTLCQSCGERKARFRYRRKVRADADHTLCFECYRGEINRARALRLGEPPTAPRRRQPFAYQATVSDRVLDERQVAHRRLMLGHLERPPVERWSYVRSA